MPLDFNQRLLDEISDAIVAKVARRLLADPETRDIPIVAMTSHPEHFSKAEALAAFVTAGENIA
jgi:CheY-like chemotaxis protein